jgi:DNA-binding NtrC family response regulator
MDYSWPGNVRELRNVAERLALQHVERPIELDDLPPEVVAPRAPVDQPIADVSTLRRAAADALFDRIVEQHQSFWSVVYDRFISHDITREDVVLVVRRGLERTRGSFQELMPLFNMEADDLKAFLSFLRKHQCLMALQVVPRTAPSSDRRRTVRPRAPRTVGAA